ncbi:hypothetical protein PsYK624_145210 [Phanerochaete sordida]|uniref:Uncharacterized protein n=1 Tax=Phanerochaete sordida TaxID=48140 RepID=A0A9P3GRS5_9APHY|nr:hypothetical protein PsYK624_145210 [Phanerochaete sordida]
MQLQLPVTTCLIRDGTAYFLILLTTNIALLITNLVPEDSAVPFNPVVAYLPPILASHFLLNLRSCANHGGAMGRSTPPPASALNINFARPDRLGNIGAPLEYPQVEDLEPDDDADHTDAKDENVYTLSEIQEGHTAFLSTAQNYQWEIEVSNRDARSSAESI